ncbi:amino acid ABC transporter substrate-binding protein [Methylocapsa sp. S129]|uniref:amino acid ABC transporter substrate-binding protein n=1 Tax=Methylocapsa sp. S129 TaxID=1641869 RepID=UPI00131D3E51|nr:amino acid ABC transporter substrate-binding protein [Methylocapsa sp. S129]
MRMTLALAAGLLALTASSAFAEDTNGADLTAPPAVNGDNAPDVLAGTLKKVRESGAIAIGYREASFPFSYVSKESPTPLGYSVDLCQGVVDEIVRELNGAPVRIDYQLVTSDTRMEAVTSGKVDLECGSTTGNTERQKSVAFSPVMFVAGTKLMVKRNSGVNSYKDLTGKTLVVTAGTTNEIAMKLLNDKYKLGIAIVSARDHEESYTMLADGKADAFATDDVLLYGFIARKQSQATMAVVGDFITYEAYGLMFRKDDPQMASAVARAYSVMAQDGHLVANYHKWFLQRTPTGELIDLPISLQLTEAWRALGVDDF